MYLSAELETCISFVRVKRARARLNRKFREAVDELESLLMSVRQSSETRGDCLCSHVKVLGCVDRILGPVSRR